MRPAHLTESNLVPAEASFASPMRQSLARPLPVGARARRLQRRILLRDHSLEGLYWMADQFVGRPLVSLLRIVPLFIRVGPKARRDCGISYSRQLADLIRMVLFHGAKPWIYYLTECYRDGGMRDVDALMMRNEMKHGVFKALNRIDDDAKDRALPLGDKLGVAEWCAEAGIAYPQPFLLAERGEITWRGDNSRNDLDRDLFVKRRRGRGASGVASYRRTGSFQYVDDDNRPITLDQILAELLRRSRRDRLMLLPFLHNHPGIADLAERSLITFRMITCLDEELRPVLTNAYLRSMTKLEPDWDVGRIEEYGSPIDLETGVLGRITGDKPECLSEWFDHHPVTGSKVTGRIVPFWRELAETAIKAHRVVPERVMIGWDIAVTAEGPVLLEGNSFTDPLFPERVFRQPIGYMRLGELLDFHFGRLEAKLDQAARS
jgi:hypothetical protein